MVGWNIKKKTEEEKFAEKLGQGDWKMGFVKCYISPTSLDERYKFLVPINEADLSDAMHDLTDMMTKLPGGMRGKLQFKTVFGSEIEGIYGKGMCAIVIEEQQYHYMSSGGPVGAVLKVIGDKLTDVYTPERLKQAFKLMASKRGSEEAYEDERWLNMQFDIHGNLARMIRQG